MAKHSDDPASRSFEQIFEDLTKLMQFTVEHMDKPVTGEIPKDLESKLKSLEKEVDHFCSINEALIAKSPPAQSTDHLTPSERKSVEKSAELIKEGEKKLKDLREAETKLPEKEMPPKKSSLKKYRRTGGDAPWKKM